MTFYKFYQLSRAICNIEHPDKKGSVYITGYPKYILLEFHLYNLSPGLYSAHIYENGNCHLLGNCLSNLGNIEVNSESKCEHVIKNPFGKNNMFGRSLVLHNNKGEIICGIIGYRNMTTKN